MKKNILFSVLRNLSFILLGVFLFYLYTSFIGVKELSRYIYSGQVKNEDYGFSFSIPEGWIAVEPHRSFVDDAIVAQFTWISPEVPDAYFDLFITKNAVSDISNLIYLDSSKEYYYYYSFERYPLECSSYNSSTEYETRGRCEMVEDMWNALQYGVLPTFFC